MLVELEQLKPNPLRDFTIDPIEPEVVERLKHSIEDHGFWGGVVCRQLSDGTIEVAAGHHRLQAAIEAGMTQADLFVRPDIDDADMVIIYATENATQRGNTSTALAGTVASVVRFLTKVVLTGNVSKFRHILASPNKTKADIESGDGVGHALISYFLQGGRPKNDKITDEDDEASPGIKRSMINHALANLKASGDYARLVHEVKAEIAAEEAVAMEVAKAERLEAERLQQEQQAAAEQERQAKEEQRAARERRRQAEVEERAARERARTARAAEDHARREAEAQVAEAKRKEAEALAALAEKRREEAEAKEQEFAALRRAAEARQKEAEAVEAKKHAASTSADKAAKQASSTPRTFDLEGVQRHLKNEHQVDVFRKIVTSPGVKPLLPVDRQAELAQHIVQEALKNKQELTARYIREHINLLLTLSKAEDRHISETQKQTLMAQDLRYKEEQLQIDIMRAATTLWASGRKLELLYANDWPKGMEYHLRPNFEKALSDAKAMIDACYARLVHGGIVKK